MIPANLIKTINGEPCVMGVISDYCNKKDSDFYWFIEIVGVMSFEMNEEDCPPNVHPGDKVWVKCCFSGDSNVSFSNSPQPPYKIYLNALGKATIYPVEQEPEVSQEDLWNKIVSSVAAANIMGSVKKPSDINGIRNWKTYIISKLTKDYTITRKTTPQ